MTTIIKHFDADNFAERRASIIGGGNAYDPDSLLIGRELMQGMTYTNSHRDYPSQIMYDAIVRGEVPVDIVPIVAPRVFNSTEDAIRAHYDENPEGLVHEPAETDPADFAGLPGRVDTLAEVVAEVMAVYDEVVPCSARRPHREGLNRPALPRLTVQHRTRQTGPACIHCDRRESGHGPDGQCYNDDRTTYAGTQFTSY